MTNKLELAIIKKVISIPPHEWKRIDLSNSFTTKINGNAIILFGIPDTHILIDGVVIGRFNSESLVRLIYKIVDIERINELKHIHKLIVEE